MALLVPAFLQPLLAKPVAVLGGGVSGDGVCALLAAVGASGRIYDAKGEAFTRAAARQHALIVYSPGFMPQHAWLQPTHAPGAERLGELDFASLFWRGRIVAITGTNGKTTLTEFLTHALRQAGREAHATGNIGYSFSRLVAETDGGSAETIAVCEVSSFQAETLRHLRAHATLWTNFAEDHLERHPGIESYFDAKWNLVARTAPGHSFLGSSVCRFAARVGRAPEGAECVHTEGQAPDPALVGTVFADYPQRENFVLARVWWKAAGLDEAALYAAAQTFALGRHRLTRVAEIAGVTYWNDSKATNFHAVEAALSRVKGPVVLIVGGKAKGGDLAGFIARIAPRVQHLVLIGATTPELARYCAAVHLAHSASASLAEAVRRAASLAVRGGDVLLSPGFASFDQFRNYEDRGEQFEKLVHELAASSADAPAATGPSLR